MLKKLVFVLAAIVFTLCALLLFREYSEINSSEQATRDLRKIVEQAREKPPHEEEFDDTILPQYEELYALNPHLVGWVRIDNTHIDYPVVKGEDNDHYLTRDFYGNYSVLGTLFLDMDSPERLRKTNWLIYGHTTASGTMFGDLKKYKDESFYQENPRIYFDTLYEEGTYEIIAVILSEVFRQSDDVFKYYKYINIEDDDTFQEYVAGVKELSLYETSVTAEPGDTLITLSTCDYYVENGRLAVIAKKVHD